LFQDAPEIGLGRTVHRPVIVGQVEVGNAVVEGRQRNAAVCRIVVYAAEVVPQAERQRRQQQTAVSATAIIHGVVAMCIGYIFFICHIYILFSTNIRRVSIYRHIFDFFIDNGLMALHLGA